MDHFSRAPKGSISGVFLKEQLCRTDVPIFMG